MLSKLTHFMQDFECDQKDGQIGVNIDNLQVVPKCCQNWLILCKILSVTKRWSNWSKHKQLTSGAQMW